MKTKKGGVIFCVGLITVLINAISSELLTSTDALYFTPDYTVVNGNLLRSLIINPDTAFNLVYNIEKSGNQIINIFFGTQRARRPSSQMWGGIPGIQINRREDYPILGLYCLQGMYIYLRPLSETQHSLMRLRLKFYDEIHERLALVEMTLIKKPTTQEGCRLAERYDVYDGSTFTSFQQLKTSTRSGDPVNLKDDFPWMQDILDRGKLMNMGLPYDNSDWYYAGAIMVNSDIITGILQLDPLWVGHI